MKLLNGFQGAFLTGVPPPSWEGLQRVIIPHRVYFPNRLFFLKWIDLGGLEISCNPKRSPAITWRLATLISYGILCRSQSSRFKQLLLGMNHKECTRCTLWGKFLAGATTPTFHGYSRFWGYARVFSGITLHLCHRHVEGWRSLGS